MKYLPIALSVLLFIAAPLHADEVIHDRWFALKLGGNPAGWAHELVTEQANGNIISNMSMELAIKRGPIALNIETATRFTETADGKPLEAATTKNFGTQATTETMTFTDTGIDFTVKQAGRQHTRKLAKPKQDWMPPAAAGRFVEKQMADGVETFKFSTMEPASGAKVLTMSWKRVGDENVELIGKTVPAHVWSVSMSHMPGLVTKQYVDDKGRSLKTRVALMPGMELEMIEADKAIAKAKINPPELVVAAMVKPDRSIDNPRQVRWAVYELTVKQPADDPDFSPTVARGGAQRVAYGDANTINVVVNLDEPTAPGDDMPGEEHRIASGVLDINDPVIKALTAEALQNIPDDATAAQKAETLRRFVNAHIDEKDLSVGFATAGETARTKQGDCSEHGVLLAAMLRAAGIPSRTVSGLVYVDQFIGQRGVFGYHMWTQAWVGEDEPKGGHWLDVDATLGDDTPYDAAHIALAFSSLSDEEAMNDMVTMVPLMGRLKIKVVDVDPGK